LSSHQPGTPRRQLAWRQKLHRIAEARGQHRIEFAQLLRQRLREECAGNFAYHAPAGHADKRRERFFVERVAEQVKTHARDHLGAAPPEQLFPLEAGQQRRQPRIAGGDDHAALVEQRQRVLRRAAVWRAARPLPLELAVMALIKRRLGKGKRQPRQRVEQVVPIAGAELHLAAQENARLVFVLERRLPQLLRDKHERPAAGGDQRRCARTDDAIEVVTAWPVRAAQPARRRAQRPEHRRARAEIRIPRRCHSGKIQMVYLSMITPGTAAT